MNKQEVIDLMRSTEKGNYQEWSDNCDKVKAVCNGYPDFWWHEIIQSGIINEVLGTNANEFKITTF